MESKYFEFDTGKGVLSLSKSKQCPGCWDFCFNEILLHSNYTDPDQAALDASKSDFGIEWLDTKLNKIYVPSDITQWRRSKRTPAKNVGNQNN
ncbi:MAG TPA: hypothetical protein VHY30_08225 [Verrucomicrobiae bacterium]|jgi:hypothetical protein|nr:hypothetical protein [Verrucomicrobiae bacterium]